MLSYLQVQPRTKNATIPSGYLRALQPTRLTGRQGRHTPLMYRSYGLKIEKTDENLLIR